VTKDFKKIAKETLDKIFSMVEKDFKEFDADFEDENLVVEINGSTFVISIHNLTNQIWLSSPKTGAHHFFLNSSNKWEGTRDKNSDLLDLLKEEFNSFK
tara:strand:- start:197 stop:493 length:297 start_codon:yes stop_codon:yes gene_type:complete